jgi:hypothetical protein
MNKRFLRFLMVPVLILALVLAGGCVAIPIDDQAINFQDQSNQLSRQLEINRQQLMSQQQQIDALRRELASAQQQLADAQRRLAETQNQVTINQAATSTASSGCDPYCSNNYPAYYNPPCGPVYNPYVPGPHPYPYRPSPPPRQPGRIGEFYSNGMYYIDSNEIY